MNAIGPAAPDERELMRSLHEGSIAALGTLYERTAPVLYPLALRIVGSRERACAVMEDLFDEIWRDRPKWGGAAEIPAVAWTARCRELALAQVGPGPSGAETRRPATEAMLAKPDATAAPSAVAGGTLRAAPSAVAGGTLQAPPGDLLRPDPRAIAREALESLPGTDRRALEEAYFNGTSAREVAVVIGAATTDAAMILRSALVRFREHMAEREAAGLEREAAGLEREAAGLEPARSAS